MDQNSTEYQICCNPDQKTHFTSKPTTICRKCGNVYCDRLDVECNYGFGKIWIYGYFYSECHNCSENIEWLKGRISLRNKLNYVLKKYNETEENVSNEIVNEFMNQRGSGKHTKSAIKNNQ